MAERKKDDKNTVEERVGKVLSEALAEELGEIPNVSISVEELRQLEKANRKKKPKKFVKFVSVAAVAVIVCAAGIYLAWPESVVPVDADKNTEQHVKEGNGEVVINEGDVQGDSGITEITESDWNKIKNYKKLVPQLGTPGYIPEEFKFKKLIIEKYKNNGFFAQYIYVGNKIELYVEQVHYDGDNVRSGFSDKSVKEISSEKGTVYILEENDKSKMAIKYIDNGELRVAATISQDKLVKIINSIELP